MTVEILYFDGCPHHDSVVAHVRELLVRGGSPPDITMRRIVDDEAAQRERFLGSPTVRVDGRDVEPGADGRTDYGMKCRLYRTAGGLTAQPQEQWLQAALGAATRTSG